MAFGRIDHGKYQISFFDRLSCSIRIPHNSHEHFRQGYAVISDHSCGSFYRVSLFSAGFRAFPNFYIEKIMPPGFDGALAEVQQ